MNKVMVAGSDKLHNMELTNQTNGILMKGNDDFYVWCSNESHVNFLEREVSFIVIGAKSRRQIREYVEQGLRIMVQY